MSECKTCQIFQADATRLKVTTIKLQEENKTLKQQIQELTQVNNTSSNNMLPSEFKASWEDMACDISEEFEKLLNANANTFANTVYNFFMNSYKSFLARKQSMIASICNTLNVPSLTDKVDALFGNFMKEHHKQIFDITESSYSQMVNNQPSDLQVILQERNFKEFYGRIQQLYVYMALNDISFPQNTCSKLTFNKSLHTCVDGFPKQNEECYLVLPAPIKCGSAYQGIKCVVIASRPSPQKQCLTSRDSSSSNRPVSMQSAHKENRIKAYKATPTKLVNKLILNMPVQRGHANEAQQYKTKPNKSISYYSTRDKENLEVQSNYIPKKAYDVEKKEEKCRTKIKFDVLMETLLKEYRDGKVITSKKHVLRNKVAK